MPWPSPDEEAELLRKLVEHRAAATGELLGSFLEPLFDWLAATNPRVDEQHREDAAVDAIASLAKRPDIYKPECGKSLGGFLKMAATGDLKNLLDKERRRASKRVAEFDVALLPARGNEIGTELEQQEEAERLGATVLSIVKDGLTPEELAGLGLLLDGEKKTEAFALVLKLDHLPPEEREAAVKRFKDKIKVRIKRAREVHDETT
jgi:hypothetical protein